MIVQAAVAEMERTLQPHVGRPWSVPAGDLEWTCHQTAAHVAHDLLSYAMQVAVRSEQPYVRAGLAVPPEASPEVVLQVVRACGTLLSDAVAARPDARAWHWGTAEAQAFAVMGVGEVLVHTYDIAIGLGLDWEPPEQLAEVVVGRLFPDAPPGPAAQVLLWSTGRKALGGRPPVRDWVWRAAR